MLTTAQLEQTARDHGLTSISVAFLAECGKFSVNVQWMNRSYRECVSGMDDDSAAALDRALAEKAAIDNRSADEKAERAARLRAELEALEQAA